MKPRKLAEHRPPAVLPALAAVALAASLTCVACGGSSTGAFQSAAADVSNAAAVAGAKTQLDSAYTAQAYDLDPADMLSIPGSSDVVSINLTGNRAHALSDYGLADIRDAIASIERLGDCGFVFLDVANGHGLVYNADEVMYVASAAKAPFIYHLVMTAPALSADERQNVEWTIVDSENEAFETLFFDHLEDGYAEWMTGFDVYHEDYSVDFYPKMSARSLASIWADILLYLQGGSADAEWLAGLFASTETSFIRDGLYGTDAVVMDKAGWIVDEDESYSEFEDEDGNILVDYDVVQYRSVSDAGVIQADGRTYLMAIVTTQPDMGMSEANVSALARALFDQRSAF